MLRCSQQVEGSDLIKGHFVINIFMLRWHNSRDSTGEEIVHEYRGSGGVLFLFFRDSFETGFMTRVVGNIEKHGQRYFFLHTFASSVLAKCVGSVSFLIMVVDYI